MKCHTAECLSRFAYKYHRTRGTHQAATQLCKYVYIYISISYRYTHACCLFVYLHSQSNAIRWLSRIRSVCDLNLSLSLSRAFSSSRCRCCPRICVQSNGLCVLCTVKSVSIVGAQRCCVLSSILAYVDYFFGRHTNFHFSFSLLVVSLVMSLCSLIFVPLKRIYTHSHRLILTHLPI